MPVKCLNEERFPDLKETRVCKTCKEEKDLVQNFKYHSTTTYFSKQCMECENKKRRETFAKRATEEGRQLDSTKLKTPRKTCIKCNIEKDIKNNFIKKGNNNTDICKDCYHKLFPIREQPLYDGPLKTKICNLCDIEKDVLNFPSFLGKSGNILLRGECKECSHKRRHSYKKGGHRSTRLYTSYKYFDTKNSLEFGITKEFLEDSLEKSCSYCASSSTGLDRINNSIGHTKENCVPCCWECNTARMNNFSYEEMKIVGEAIRQVKERRIKNN